MSLLDRKSRPLRNLRLSVTDRCNLRCAYCMPEPDYVWLPRDDLLSFEEIVRLVQVFGEHGVNHLRLTGGEPLLRRDLAELVHQLAGLSFLDDLALTTNGVLLEDQAQDLKDAGLRRITVSLDTLRSERFEAMTRRKDHARVLRGIEAARSVGLPLKLDTVLIRGSNDDEALDLIDFAGKIGAEIRFIEYMDVGGATRWDPEAVVSRQEMLERFAAALGTIEEAPSPPEAPADRYRLPSGQVFGIISSTTQPFCGLCDRSRVTADGRWFRCLYATQGSDLRALIRGEAGLDGVREEIRRAWGEREDQGAIDRLALHERRPLADGGTLRDDPHLEMHTRGG